ncbi:MAG: AAA family ATPase [Planctomycetia bacterium]|nr:AAA family ATPase [Planctomycetia bacterium]
MATTIAISGKGGSGKTTVAAMITRFLSREVAKTTLAVDADPNSCLGLALGVEPGRTVSDIREDALEKRLEVSPGMSKMRSFEYGIQQLIEESRGFDLLTMGRPEGPKCYCAVNNILRGYLDALADAYPFIVMDNEAGMEHLSRRTTNNVDWLYIIAEPTAAGILTANRIQALAGSLPIAVRNTSIVWNKVTGELPPEVVGAAPAEATRKIPNDQAVAEASQKGATVFDLPADNPALLALYEIVSKDIGVSTASS